jgi:hypothetical protein
LLAVQTQNPICKILYQLGKKNPLTEKNPAYRSCPHPITAPGGNLTTDGGGGMRLSTPAKSLLDHLLCEEWCISW